MKRSLPLIVGTIFLAYVGAAIARPMSSAGRFDIDRFGRLPIWVNGRVEPIDSAARRALLQIRGTVTVPEDGTRPWQVWKRTASLDATEWLLEVLTKPDTADSRRIFRIDDAAVRTIALEAPHAFPVFTHSSFRDLQPRVKEIGEQVARAWSVKPADRTRSDRAWLELRDDLVLYERLKNTVQPNSVLQSAAGGKPIAYDFGAQLATYTEVLRTAVAARRAGKDAALDKETEDRVLAFARPYVAVSRTALLSLVPPVGGDRGDRWTNTGVAIVASSRTGTFSAALPYLARIGSAYANGKTDHFNRELTDYERWLAARRLNSEVRRASTESFYNRFQPLVRAVGVYLVALLFAVAAITGRSATLYRCAVTLTALAATLHVAGVLFDMMLQGTIPVANVYSAIICAGGIGTLLCGLVEARYRQGLAVLAAAILGAATLIGAHALTSGGAAQLAIALFDASFLTAVLGVVIVVAVMHWRTSATARDGDAASGDELVTQGADGLVRGV